MPSSAKKNPKRRLKAVVHSNMEDRQEQVGKLYCQGITQSEIAKQLGVSQPTVSCDLLAVRERWKERANASYDQKVQEELAKIDALEATAQQALLRSQQPKVDAEGNEGPPQAGNPAFMDKIGWCIETRLKLLGKLDERSVQVNQTVVNWDSLHRRELNQPDPVEDKIRQLEERASAIPQPSSNGSNGDGHHDK